MPRAHLLDTPPPDDADTRMRAAVDSLQEQYRDVRGDESEEGRRARAQLGARLARLSHDQIHPGEQMILVDVPTAVTGEPFIINDTVYPPGQHAVPACVAATLLHMMDANRRVDADRMNERGRTFNLGVIGERARVIQRDD